MQSIEKQCFTYLKNNFGHDSFRPGQLEIILSLLEGLDVIAVLPTGAGKSLCYQLPAILQKKFVLVVSPLISLMKDQVIRLRNRGIASGAIYSNQPNHEFAEIIHRQNDSGTFVLFVSPERISDPVFLRWLEIKNIGLVAVDEAHCIVQWGNDFRHDYLKLGKLRNIFPKVPLLALTASATHDGLFEIETRLKMVNPKRNVQSPYRPNLYYQIEKCETHKQKVEWVNSAVSLVDSGKVIIYVATRKGVEELASQLKQSLKTVGFYHAGLSERLRTQTQIEFVSSKIRILVATNAFGLGIDIPDVRLVIHFNLPGTIEAFYQESGRAGRDGKPARCLLLHSKKDIGLQNFFIRSALGLGESKFTRKQKLASMVNLVSIDSCRHSEILQYFNCIIGLQNCGHCDSCAPKSNLKISLNSRIMRTLISKPMFRK